jgi:hypothetical protein
MKFKIALLSLVIVIISAVSAKSQIALHPTAAFIDPVSNTGSMTIRNTSNSTREIDVKFKYGHQSYDSLGKQKMYWADSSDTPANSLVPYIKVFPKRLMIPPNEQATVRFLVRGLPAGEEKLFFARIVAGSVPEVEQIDTISVGKVSARMVMRSEMIGLVALMKGKNTASLDFKVGDVFEDSTKTKLNILIICDKSGNAPFWGSMESEIYDSEDDLVDKTTTALALYADGSIKLQFDKSKFPAGEYKAKVFVTNQRKEIPEKYLPELFVDTREFDFEVK